MKPSRSDFWRTAVVYQVYVRSFADESGDGIGDIAGLESRLDYLRDLGVDAIWLNPWYVSPFRDGGYDVADYRDIDPRLGTLDDATRFIARARERGLRVIVDLVPNHTSSDHRWFQEALAEGPGDGPARARYHFRRGRGDDGSKPPTDWKSIFGGPAWTRLPDGEWYLHLFDPSQPDLNWTNPEVRQEFADIIRFWLDRGAAGFRVDVAHGLVKHPEFPDLGDVSAVGLVASDGDHPYFDRNDVHDIYREWRAILDAHPTDAVLVAEAWVESWERLALYLRPDEYHQAFNFDFLLTPWKQDAMRAAIDRSLKGTQAVGALPTWVLSNHDVVRHATRYGLPAQTDVKTWLVQGTDGLDAELGLRRARAASLMMLALPGSAYLYQGEELGLPEVVNLPEEVLEDPVWQRSGGAEKGRDGCRVPLPWSESGPALGFGEASPWLPQPTEWGSLSVAAQVGVAGSTLELYRSALALRREHLRGGTELEWQQAPAGALRFRREGGLSVTVNFGPDPVELPEGDVLITSAPLDADGRLPADATAWTL